MGRPDFKILDRCRQAMGPDSLLVRRLRIRKSMAAAVLFFCTILESGTEATKNYPAGFGNRNTAITSLFIPQFNRFEVISVLVTFGYGKYAVRDDLSL